MTKKFTVLTTSLASIILLAGCATPPPPPAPPKAIPDSMYVIAPSANDALSRMEEKAAKNISLLEDLVSKKPFTGEKVSHVQGLDARDSKDLSKIHGPHGNFVAEDSKSAKMKNSRNSTTNAKENYVEINGKRIEIKKSLGDMSVPVDEKGRPTIFSNPEKVNSFNKLISLVNWKNSSANELFYKIANSVDYEFEIVQLTKYNDTYINYEATQTNSLEVLNSLGLKYNQTFEILVSHPRQKLVVIYK